MNKEPQTPKDLAAFVADGHPADWDEALREASTDEDRRIIAHLRLVENVSRVFRNIGSISPFPESPAPPPTMNTMDLSLHSDVAVPKKTWGSLELREKLGEGGFGEVYRAWDSRLEREVALKLLKTDPSREKALTSQVIEEGRLLAKLRHTNVVTVYGAEVHDGRVGLWMELVRGRSLAQLLRDQGPFGAREAALIGIDLCRALGAVHGAGVVHRDVKAENVMREEGGRILLADFGAGVDVSAAKAERERSVSGTPMYMASELLFGKPANQRTDIFSLGVLLYRLVTGKFPIEAKTWNELLAKHSQREAKLLRDRRQDLPEGFVAAVERAMAWAPEDRFATAGQMEQALSLSLGTGSGTASTESTHASTAQKRPSPLRSPFVLSGIGILAIIALVMALRWKAEQPVPETIAREEGVATAPTSPSATPASASYNVEAALYRVSAKTRQRERLESGAPLALGDNLSLEFKASAPLYVYIINEDEAGHSYALFPIPGLDLKNPLPADATHLLPGTRDGNNLSWTVDSPGGREHLMVLASPERLVEFEAEMSSLAQPGQIAVSIPEAAMISLRGIGGLHETPVSSERKTAGRLFEMAQQLAAHSEVVHGVWMRRIDLENPAP